MALQPKRSTEDTSLRGIVSRALGTRSKQPEDPAPELQEVLSDLHVGEQQNGPAYEINRIHFAETEAPAAPSAAAPAASTVPKTSALADLEAHRRRLEQLLDNARQIEELLAKEAAQARTLAENLQLEEKRAAAAEAAENLRKADAEARAYARNGETATAAQIKADAELALARQEFTKAEASVSELQARLADARNLVVLSKAKVLEAEAKSKEAAKRTELAKTLIRDAEIRVAKCREAREAAQAEIAAAEEIASSIALTSQMLRRIRDLGSTKTS